MKNIRNNLFKFATKETSQDSFFSWVINWFNYKDKLEYNNFSKEFLLNILPNGLLNKIEDIDTIKIIRQFFDIDILLVLNMKDGKQYFLIIENKTISELGKQQLDTIIYYTKLVYNYKYNKDKFSRFEIDTNEDDSIEKRIYCVLIKTGIKYLENYDDENNIKDSLVRLNKSSDEYSYYNECKNYIENSKNDFWNNHIKFINTADKLERLVNVLKKHKHIDSLIEDYYDSLVFNLENDSILSNKENSIDFIIKNGILEEDKTHFRTNYLCLMCFNHLRKEELKDIDTRRNGINLDNLDVTFDNVSDRNVIKVLTLDFNKGNDFENSFILDDIWREQQEKESTDNIRYVYLFTKENDYFNDTYYTFRGLFKFLKRVNDIKYWKKCKVSENGKVSIKKQDVEKYIKTEEDLSNWNE